MFATVEDGFSYLESFVNTERGDFKPRTWRLSRMRSLLDAFGNPQLATRTVHVAGSKGKGSTACYIASICHAAGERVGLYSSPHVMSYRERIRVLDGSLTDEVFLAAFEQIKSFVDARRDIVPEAELPTTFELLTLLGFLCFRDTGCSISVIEVGLGGRLDATSLVRPECCVITPIEYEHTEYLGTTLRSIASEKGAIMRRGVPAYSAPQAQEAEQTLRRIAELRSVRLRMLDEQISSVSSEISATGTECSFRLPDGTPIDAKLPMLGHVQTSNAALASLAATAVLPELSGNTIAAGLSRAVLPGRSEIVPGEPSVLLDGAHTPHSIQLLARTVQEICPDRERRSLVFGSVAGKRHRQMLEILVKLFPTVVVCRPGTFKQSDPQQLAETVRELGGRCALEEDPQRALAAANPDGRMELIVITGSFYLVGKIRAALIPEAPDEAGMPNVTELG